MLGSILHGSRLFVGGYAARLSKKNYLCIFRRGLD